MLLRMKGGLRAAFGHGDNNQVRRVAPRHRPAGSAICCHGIVMMLRRIYFPLALGVAGVAVLLALAVWQLQRQAWKTAVLDRISATITAPPVDLPAQPDPVADQYLPVTVTGTASGSPIAVLVSTADFGAGYRMITAFDTVDGRRVLADLGFLGLEDRLTPLPAGPLTVTGNLLWPDEVDSWTPDPDPSGIWFARDLPAMAVALDTDPVLVVSRSIAPASPTAPMPVGITGIPNNHLGYAITWFMLAVGWAMMTGLLIFRTLRRKET